MQGSGRGRRRYPIAGAWPYWLALAQPTQRHSNSTCDVRAAERQLTTLSSAPMETAAEDYAPASLLLNPAAGWRRCWRGHDLGAAKDQVHRYSRGHVTVLNRALLRQAEQLGPGDAGWPAQCQLHHPIRRFRRDRVPADRWTLERRWRVAWSSGCRPRVGRSRAFDIGKRTTV